MWSLIEVADQLSLALSLAKTEAPEALVWVALIGLVHIVNVMVGMRLCYLGILPRTLRGLIGIPFAPFLHGNFNHLFFNAIPLFLLIDFMLVATGPHFISISLFLIGFSGFLTWLIGRRGLHVGASSLIMAYWGYLLVLSIRQPTVFNLVIVVVMLYYLGGLFFSLFPSDVKTSFEGHIAGFIAGISLAWFMPYLSQGFNF